MIDNLETITAALDIARWAPSSHNSQPWEAEIGPSYSNGMREVLIRLDEAARLRALNSLDAEMAISLGLFVGIMCRAMTISGLPWECHELPPSGVILRVGPPSRSDVADLLGFEAQVNQRGTCRAPFNIKPLTSDQIGALERREWARLGIGSAATTELFLDNTTCENVAALVAHYGKLDFSNYAAWSETYAHIHFCSAEDLRDDRGFSIETLLGPMSALKRFGLRLGLHPISIQLLRPFGIPGKLAQALAHLTRTAPGLLVLVADNPIPSFADLVETGNRLAELWLGATGQSVQIHPLSVLLQHDAPRTALRTTLGLTGTPQFVARIGEQVSPAMQTPRIPTGAILRSSDNDLETAKTVPLSNPIAS